MRITIDGTSLLLRSAGIKNYIYYWVQHLRQCGGDLRIDVFPFLGELAPLNHEASLVGPLATYARLALHFLVNLPRSPVLDWVLPATDLFHGSNQVRNPPRRVALTATLYDLTCLLMPEIHTAANVRADTGYLRRVAPRARRLLAISESTKADGVRLLGLNADRIEVVYPGVPDCYFNAGAPARIAKPYVLSLGTIEPRKNLDTLLEAWSGAPAVLRGQYDLVVAGPPGWASEKTLARLRGTGGVRYLSYVPESDLPALTAGAAVFAYPSLYEGFGLPVAQAMAAGVPVVTSNVSALPEIAGDAALLVDPRSPAEIGAAIVRLLESETLRRQLGERGAARARTLFRWSENVRRSIGFFRRALG